MMHAIDLSRVDLNLLVLFEAVMEARHVGRAADRLHLSSPAVSHGLGRLRRVLNDPLFVRTPKGVVPTERALALAAPVADLLALARRVVATAAPFDPATSRRRFTIGALDGIMAVVLRSLLETLRVHAPFLDVSVRQLLPLPGETSAERAFRAVFADLDARAMDIAIIPSDHIPARFHQRTLYEEDFVVAVREGHPFADDPSLDRYCQASHLMVSPTGDPHGIVDDVLAGQGRLRRVALTVPNFLLALAGLAETDLVATMPRRFVALHGARFGVISLDVPFPLGRFRLNAVAPQAAMMDAGLAWLFEVLVRTESSGPRSHEHSTE